MQHCKKRYVCGPRTKIICNLQNVRTWLKDTDYLNINGQKSSFEISEISLIFFYLRHQRDNMQRRITNVWESSKAWTVLSSEREKKSVVFSFLFAFKKQSFCILCFFLCILEILGREDGSQYSLLHCRIITGWSKGLLCCSFHLFRFKTAIAVCRFTP